MRATLAAAAVVVVLVLLAPPVEARSGNVEADVRAPDAHLSGVASFSTTDGALNLTGAAERSEPLSISWTGANGSLVATDWTVAAGPVGDPLSRSTPGVPRALSFGAGRLAGLACGDGCVAILVASGGAGRVGLSGTVDGDVRWTDKETRYYGDWSDGRANTYSRTFPRGTVTASARDLAGAKPDVAGRVTLFFKNATAIVQLANGSRETLDARYQHDPVAQAPGVLRAEQVHSRFVRLDLENASLDAAPGSSAVFLAEAPRVTLQGAIDASDASGYVRFAGRTVELERDAVRIEGPALDLALQTTHLLPSLASAVVDSTALDGGIGGEASRVTVGASTLAPPRGAQDDIMVGATIAALLALAAATLRLLPWAPFYSRISPARVLANPNRAALHELVSGEPGLTQAELRRRTGLARVVVAHHLRMLEAHQYVKRRRDGRRLRFFPATALPDEASFAVRFALEDESRRKVVEALARATAAAGLTQKEIADATRLSQRLVSYHLRRLDGAGLVRCTGPMPRRYALQPGAAALGSA